MPSISVIIPLYNKEAYIRDTINSVLKQGFAGFEILVIDDGSTDSSLSVVKSIKDKRIKVISHNKNKGLSASRNTGIKEAKGHIIALLDADDLWKSNHLEQLMALYKNYPKTALYGCAWAELLPNKKIVPVKLNDSVPTEGHKPIENFFEANLNQPLICPSSFAFKKEIVDQVGFFDETINYSEDVDFYIRANTRYRFAYNSKVSCRYSLYSENQITRSGIGNKVFPDYDFYETKFKQYTSLKKYIDRKRYFLSILYKTEGLYKKQKELQSKIHPENLTYKQQIMLSLPGTLIRKLRSIKHLLLKYGIRVTSF